MNKQICLLLLVSLAALLVNSESTIEVDENGDEYDVKRFNIQGRNLNEGRSQCVEIRRKRATPSQPQPQPVYFNDDASNDEIENTNNESDVVKTDDEPPTIFYSPAALSTGPNDEDNEDKETEDNDLNKMNTEGEEVTLSYLDANNNKTKSENVTAMVAEKLKENIDNDALEVVKLPQLPSLGQLKDDGEVVPARVLAAANVNEADTNGIVVIQSKIPPKVNPQTHAVFELVPVKNEVTAADGEGEDKDDDDTINGEYDSDLNEELLPISTSDQLAWAIDGDNNSNGAYEDYDEKPLIVHKVNRNKKPVKRNKPTRKPAMKPKRKNKYNNSVRQGLTSGNKRKNGNKNHPNKSNKKRPNNLQKRKPGNINCRRKPNKNKQNIFKTQNKNKIINNSFPNNKHKNFNTRNRLIAKRNKNKKYFDNGEHIFSHTTSWTEDDDYDADKNVNCIIIHKDPPAPTTTERPFWNFWGGRSTNGTRQASANFGLRKRANVHFNV